MSKLNQMMGAGGSEDGGEIKRKVSWETIPLFVGGEIKITPEEARQREEEELLAKLSS
jgi:hypothetical protein